MGEYRSYQKNLCITFRKTKEKFGGLSNMAPGFPLRIGDLFFYTSEALYQAARFPHCPEIQGILINTKSPMTGKMKTKKYRDDSRNDWDKVRVKVMRWCLRVKLICNWNTFGELLLSTEEKPIVEISHRDKFWGTVEKDETLVGENVLGRLLMELRQQLMTNRRSLEIIRPPSLDNFVFMGQTPPDLTISNTKLNSNQDELF